jgi:hypothetical protein
MGGMGAATGVTSIFCSGTGLIPGGLMDADSLLNSSSASGRSKSPELKSRNVGSYVAVFTTGSIWKK